ncbi:MAG TPA: hypothetical protein VK338_05090, partial [Candidatus Nitrosocosmicus sp.]|nr:hypothetical protein [Candidatus Nitrosocosmicus sp.]
MLLKYFLQIIIGLYFIVSYNQSVIYAQGTTGVPTSGPQATSAPVPVTTTPTPTTDPKTLQFIDEGRNLPGEEETKMEFCGMPGSDETNMCCKSTTFDSKGYSDKVGGDIPDLPIGEMLGVGKVMGQCKLGEAQVQGDKCICVMDEAIKPNEGLSKLCRMYNSPRELDSCINCAEKYGGLLTGFGCVPLQLGNFINSFLMPRAVGLAGLIAFFCIIIS